MVAVFRINEAIRKDQIRNRTIDDQYLAIKQCLLFIKTIVDRLS